MLPGKSSTRLHVGTAAHAPCASSQPVRGWTSNPGKLWEGKAATSFPGLLCVLVGFCRFCTGQTEGLLMAIVTGRLQLESLSSWSCWQAVGKGKEEDEVLAKGVWSWEGPILAQRLGRETKNSFGL